MKGVPLDNFPKNAVYCDVPPSFIQKNIIYVVIVLGTAIVLLLFYFMHKRIKKVRETEWQEHLHLLENILDNLPIAAKVKDVDNDMRYTFINKKAEELFEYPAKEAIGRTDFDIMPEAAIGRLSRIFSSKCRCSCHSVSLTFLIRLCIK